MPRSILRTLALIVAAGLGVAATATVRAAEDTKPNVLILIGDDATYNDLPLYGGTNIETPRIDRLASQGLVFDQAYTTMSMCLPCRSELYTGLFPARNGACWNHSRVRPGTRSIVHRLGDLGYRVGIAGKIHVRPRKAFPFEKVPGVTRGSVSPKAEFDPAGVREFMGRNEGEPFCLVIGFNSPHVVWTVGDPDKFNKSELKLPEHFVDTPQTREDFARYLAEIEVLDQQVGKALDLLKSTGNAEDTLVLFTSEQGAQFPGCKWTCWDAGVHSGMVARWPGRITPGQRTDAIVQYADVLPTILDAAGKPPDAEQFDGRSFLPVLLGKRDTHREYAFAMHNNVPEGPPYPIRAVTDGEYRYIRNLRPEEMYIEKHLTGVPEHNPYWSTWMRRTFNDPHAYAMVKRWMRRPAEQLYHTAEDPYELNNLADDPEYAEVKQRLSDALDRWMARQGDPGAAIDTREELRAARRGDHFERKSDDSR